MMRLLATFSSPSVQTLTSGAGHWWRGIYQGRGTGTVMPS
jgi:hypothetical protein